MHLTEKLVGVQSDFEDAKTKLTTLNNQLVVKEADIDRLKAQVNVNKTFERECDDLRKGLQAKEQQLQTYRTEMDEVELSLSQAESKYDEYVEMCRNLRDENQHLKDDIEGRSKEQAEKIIEIRKDLENKHETEMNELKANQEKDITRLKEIHEDEVLTLREKLDAMRRRSLATATSSAPTLLPDSRDSARFSTTESEYASRAFSTWKSAKTATTIVEVKTSDSSRLGTASSDAKGKDSALDRSSSIFVSMSNTPLPRTPKTADTLGPSVSVMSREASPVRTAESSTQTDDVIDNLVDVDEISEVKSKTDLLEIEREMAKTPTNELPQKLDEYKSKFAEIEQQLQEEVLQWKLRFNTKAQALNELMLSQEKQEKEKDELMEQLSIAQEQKVAAEQEAEKAILQLEELNAEKDSSLHMGEDGESLGVVQTESKGTATSASLYRMQNIMDAQDTLQTSVGIQCPSSTQVSRKPSTRSPQYSDIADEQEMLLFGGLNASDSGFGGSSNVLHPDESGNLQNEVDPSKFAFHPRSPSSVASSGRVRSRLVRSALRDHRVVVETVRTYEMISEFKMNIVIWLQQHGLAHKSELLTAIPDITLNKEDELDVLSKMSAIRDTTQQILDALWQVTKDDYSWSQHDLVDGKEEQEENSKDNNVRPDDIGIEMDTKKDDGLSSSPVARQHGDNDDEKVNVQSQEHNLQDRSVQTTRRRMPRPTPTTPKGYTRLLHEYNNLNEEYSTLTQQLQENVKSYQEQISENAGIMNEMQETINNLRSQLTDGNASGRISTPPSISSLMFTRLDAERNVKSMKRAVLTKRLSQDSYNTVIQEMNQYVSLPGRRLAELVKRYRHHCIMKDVEENLNPVRITSTEVYDLQERMEHLQTVRARNWSKKMAEMGRERSELGDKITSSLKEIEESSGIFLIKPVYSYVSMPPEVERSSHPVICKKRSPLSAEVPSENTSKPGYPLETTRTPGWTFRQSIDRPMWISKDSHVTDSGTRFDDNPMPRLLAMDVNRFTLSKNLISGSFDMKSGSGGVRQYVTVERPIGTSKPVHVDRSTKVPTPSLHTFPVDSRASSPGSFTPYPPLPPINLPHSHISSATSATNQSGSSLSLTSFDENFAR